MRKAEPTKRRILTIQSTECLTGPFKNRESQEKYRSLPDGEIIKESWTSLNSLPFERKLHCDWFPAVKSQFANLPKSCTQKQFGTNTKVDKRQKHKHLVTILFILILMVNFSNSISSVLGYPPVLSSLWQWNENDVILEQHVPPVNLW